MLAQGRQQQQQQQHAAVASPDTECEHALDKVYACPMCPATQEHLNRVWATVTQVGRVRVSGPNDASAWWVGSWVTYSTVNASHWGAPEQGMFATVTQVHATEGHGVQVSEPKHSMATASHWGATGKGVCSGDAGA
eukprot:scaffold142861_cov21-Tisochrysis_lutea.AAC.1